MPGFSIYGNLNGASKKNACNSKQGRVTTSDIPLSSIYSNDQNFYPQDGIQELAAKILMVGLIEPPAVKYAPCEKGDYCIVDGERRWRALNYLVKEGHKGFETVTVAFRAPDNIHAEKIELIIGNSYRTKDSATLMKEAETLKEELLYMKKHGLKLNGYDLQKGRLRDIIADILQINPSKVGELEAIRRHLSPEFLEQLESGNIKQSNAYQLSKLSILEQDQLFSRYLDKGKLESGDIKEFLKEKEEAECKASPKTDNRKNACDGNLELLHEQKKILDSDSQKDSIADNVISDDVSPLPKEQENRHNGKNITALKSTGDEILSEESSPLSSSKIMSFEDYLTFDCGASLKECIQRRVDGLADDVADLITDELHQLLINYQKFIEGKLGRGKR